MLRTSLLSLAALSFAALGATSAGAGSFGAQENYGDAAGTFELATHKCHYHYRYKREKYVVGYDSYGNPIYGYRRVRIKWCHYHKHYSY
jgi:hypothetical protein